MKKEINPKIVDTIDELEENSIIKDFLMNLLDFEHEHSEQRSPRYTEYYNDQIKKFAQLWWNK
ncbi:hypothetical protein FGU46_10350 [Methanobacterium sp. CWC-01]|uniref:hypothetical protein n=1 Tax=Methanobacterium aridiramus TaxID=2584467 RepID=UPI0025787EA4|nr:hypothetical protein [Methanobacterium sp. CWC-01]WJI10460.1 hypothetical protein FGU46_10350 [Methanobacterium sp. CWC-01]